MPQPLIDSHALVAALGDPAWPLASGAAPVSAEERAAERDAPALLAALDANGGRSAVLLQRGRFYGYDNSYICHAAAFAPHRLRTVCAVDGSAEDCAEQARHWLSQPGTAGLRFMAPGPDAATLDWLAAPHARAAWAEAAERGALVQVHMFPWARAAAIPLLLELAGAFPTLNLVADNLSNIDLSAGAPFFGMDELFTRLAECPRVHLRVTTSALHRARLAGVCPAEPVAAVASRIGPERLLWGTDIIPGGMDYAGAIALAHEATATLSAVDRARVLHDNAARLFFGT